MPLEMNATCTLFEPKAFKLIEILKPMQFDKGVKEYLAYALEMVIKMDKDAVCFIFKQFSFKKRIVFFGRNSGIHGFRHIFRANANAFVRLFWVLIVLVSSGFMYLILDPVLERGDQVNFTPDTRYLTWTTTFPAVTVCEAYNFKMSQKKLISLYPELMDELDYDFKKYLTELVFGRGTCSKKLCTPCGNTMPCDLPWREMIDKAHKKCAEMVSDCSFNGEEFPCCMKFHPVDSEYGYCYSFNTLQYIYPPEEPLYTVNITTGPGLLTFRVLNDSYVTVHSPEELSTNILDFKFGFDVKTVTERQVEYLFSLVEVENEPVLRTESIEARACRYLDEIPKESFHMYQVYSYGACNLAEQTEHLFEHCGCIHPIRHPTYQNFYCNYTGMNCVVTQEALKLKVGPDGHDDDIEECVPSCDESELTTIHISKLPKNRNEVSPIGTLVKIRMSALPTLRYRRNLVRTDLDFVVSIGGIVGLFFAASVLSVVEIPYLIWRPQ